MKRRRVIQRVLVFLLLLGSGAIVNSWAAVAHLTRRAGYGQAAVLLGEHA